MGSLFDDDDVESATMITQVSEELLAASGKEDEERVHFRKVFDEFLKMKKNCGETVTGLTFDRFRQTLEQNRDVILSKHSAKGVRFSVYKKNGKAALKATPVGLRQ